MKITWEWTGEEATLEDIINQVGVGWSNILERLVKDLELLGWDGKLLQVKEKFGMLRFYIPFGSDEIDKRIEQAEDESINTCELCSKPGKPDHSQYWIITLCSECSGKRKKGVLK